MKNTLLSRANAIASRRKTHWTMRRQATYRCPNCGSRVTIEAGAMRCTKCEWKCIIHDVA